MMNGRVGNGGAFQSTARCQFELYCAIEPRKYGGMMKMNQRNRRIIAVILVLLGITLLILTPEGWPGTLMLILGIALELFGIALERKAK